MSRLHRAARAVPFVLLMAILAAILLWVLNQLDTGARESDRQQAEITALQAGLEEANARLEAEGEQPVPVPEVDASGEVEVVPIPPTPDQTNDAVAEWFATHDLSLTSGYRSAMQDAVERHLTRNPPAPGEDGEDAPGPTDLQIADAVATYLIANPPADGANGANGKDGRGVVSAALDGCDVVFTYTDGDTDRVGPICGANGRDGKDGRGIVKTECHTTGDWIFTWSDGTASTVTGPCRVTQPSPTPSPTATTTKGR